MIDFAGITRRFAAVRPVLDERSRRLVAASESAAIGRGGVSAEERRTSPPPARTEALDGLAVQIHVHPNQ